mgnify:CR=1 FL=1
MQDKIKNFQIKFNNELSILFIKYHFLKFKGMSLRIQCYKNSLDYGFLAVGIDISYRLKNIDHKGLTLILKLILFEIELEISDNRHNL